jgi:hypothetical protein
MKINLPNGTVLEMTEAQKAELVKQLTAPPPKTPIHPMYYLMYKSSRSGRWLFYAVYPGEVITFDDKYAGVKGSWTGLRDCEWRIVQVIPPDILGDSEIDGLRYV